ncbi:DUF6234 family protein [Streptomyces sp. NBC_01353]|uniref:DUF6234 family protein n=1 Tax=Streptomyces sp. NBC_01353 TaxID=2903835 RepID=UPI002E2EC464|nr:DUF6234 family protein [Streptomyces sp. NBC_01353]
MTRPSMGSDRPGNHADRGADIGAGCGLMFLELVLLVVIFGLWVVSGLSLDPANPGTTDSLWRYLPWAGGVGVLALVAAVFAAKARAMVTVISQGIMATLVAVIIVGGMAGQKHEDARNRPAPEQPDIVVGCRSGGDNSECAHTGG